MSLAPRLGRRGVKAGSSAGLDEGSFPRSRRPGAMSSRSFRGRTFYRRGGGHRESIEHSIPSSERMSAGGVIAPEDATTTGPERCSTGGSTADPAVIVRVKDDTDVVRVVSVARESGLELAVRSGGHSIPGHSVSEGGIVLDLGDMRAVDVDAEGRTAWAETGLDRPRVHDRLRDARPRDRVRRHGLGRDRRDHARGRRRLPRPKVRPDDRRPAGGRHRDRGRRCSPRRRRARAGPVLGDPRRGRELRRRDTVQVPAARDRHRGRRHAAPARHRRRDRRLHGRGRGRARGALVDRERDAGAADAVRPGGGTRQARHHGAHDPTPETPRPGSGPRAIPSARGAGRGPAPTDAVSGGLPARGRGVPPVATARTCSSTRSAGPRRRRSSNTSRPPPR